MLVPNALPLRTALLLIMLAITPLAGPSSAATPAAITAPCPLQLQGQLWLTAASQAEGPRCRQGADTAALGWRLIDYGVATLKYVVGLILIMLGGMLVVLGWVVSLVEALVC